MRKRLVGCRRTFEYGSTSDHHVEEQAMSMTRIRNRVDQLETAAGAVGSPVSVVFVHGDEDADVAVAATSLPANAHPVVVRFRAAGSRL